MTAKAAKAQNAFRCRMRAMKDFASVVATPSAPDNTTTRTENITPSCDPTAKRKSGGGTAYAVSIPFIIKSVAAIKAM